MIPKEDNKIQNEILKKMPGWKRLKIAFELNEFARTLIRANIKQANPNFTDNEINKLVAERCKK